MKPNAIVGWNLKAAIVLLLAASGACLGQYFPPSGGVTSNQKVRTVGAVLTPTSTTACVPIEFSGKITSFQMLTGDGGSAGSVTVKVQTVARSSYTGGSSTSDISNGGESLSSAAEMRDTTLASWTTSLSADTAVCFVASSFSGINAVNANITVAAN